MTGNEKKFWLFFILLNCLLFLPAYIVNSDTSSFLPIKSFTQDPWYLNVKSFFKRPNYDIFRLSIDLTLLVTVFYLLRNKVRVMVYSSLASVYYLVVLIFLVYYHSMYKIYLVEPLLFNDIYLLKLGYHNLGGSLLIVASVLIGIAILYYLVFKLFTSLLNQLKQLIFGKTSRIILWIFGLLLLFNFIKSGITLNANHVFQIAGAKMVDNIVRSSEASENISQLSIKELNKKSDAYNAYQLASKPDIYLLFVESYGKIVYQDSAFHKIYAESTARCEKELKDSGWHIASNFSLSPVSGGGSWISFSSVMFGFRFPNQGTYLYFLRNKETQKYTNIIRYFKRNGYKSYWINSMPDNVNMEIPWKLYTDFYGVDKWITYEELNYRGKLYGFGPSPPDQFSLFKAEQIINEDNKRPGVVFYITHNSHNPFYSPDSISENWKTLSTGQQEADPPSMFIIKPEAADYIKSINYELRAITRFITQTNNRNALYLIIGDHQPPVLTTEINGFETPVHIVASDSSLISRFKNYGFSEGLFVNKTARSIRHEAIYSMFLHETVRRFGTDTTNLPPYLPMGFNPK